MTDTLDRPGAHAPTVHPRRQRSAAWPVQFWSTAVGKKWVMAVTGIGLMGFVFAHMVGNAKMFLGATEYNRYAEASSAALRSRATEMRTRFACAAPAARPPARRPG